MTAIDRAITTRLRYLRRDLEIAELEAQRELLDVNFLPEDQREPFEAVNSHIVAARNAIPRIRAEIAELESAL